MSVYMCSVWACDLGHGLAARGQHCGVVSLFPGIELSGAHAHVGAWSRDVRHDEPRIHGCIAFPDEPAPQIELPRSFFLALPVLDIQSASPAKGFTVSELYTQTSHPAGSRGAVWVERLLSCGRTSVVDFKPRRPEAPGYSGTNQTKQVGRVVGSSGFVSEMQAGSSGPLFSIPCTGRVHSGTEVFLSSNLSLSLNRTSLFCSPLFSPSPSPSPSSLLHLHPAAMVIS